MKRSGAAVTASADRRACAGAGGRPGSELTHSCWATVVTRTTSSGEKSRDVVFHAADGSVASGKQRKVWELVPSGLMEAANARKAEVEVALRKSGKLCRRRNWPHASVALSAAHSASVLLVPEPRLRAARAALNLLLARAPACVPESGSPAPGARTLLTSAPLAVRLNSRPHSVGNTSGPFYLCV
jgi:hypothetical protein